MRKIIHIDMDAFYAAVEARDNPHLQGKALAVGSPHSRGVVLTANYEARKFGVGSAMSSVKAQRLCPQLIFMPPRFEVYREVSKEIRNIFFDYSDLVEPISLDEAYIDVSEAKKGPASAVLIARAIKNDIFSRTQLSASAGVASGKFLAKMASGMNKPNGLSVILPKDAEAFMAKLPIEAFHGIGRATAQRMKEMGIYTGADLREHSLELLTERFGKVGWHYYKLARAIDDRPVDPNREQKSVGAEDTFSEDTLELSIIAAELKSLAKSVAQRLARPRLMATTITLKLKFDNFVVRSRSQSLMQPIDSASDIERIALYLLHREPLERPLRLVGITASKLQEKTQDKSNEQLGLF